MMYVDDRDHVVREDDKVVVELGNSPGRSRLVLEHVCGKWCVVEEWFKVDGYLMGRSVKELMENGFNGSEEEAEELLKEEEYVNPKW